MSVVTRLQAGQAGFPFPGGEINVSYRNLKAVSGDHPASNSMGIGDLLWWSKQPRREADHSLQLSEDIKNE